MVRTLISLRERNSADPLLRVVFSTSAQDERAVVREYFTTQVTGRWRTASPAPMPGCAPNW